MFRTSEEMVLEGFFGYSNFRDGQHDIVKSIVAGENLMVVMATGFGKSVCFQVPALMTERCTIVISPIIALMDDQVAALRAIGVPAYTYNSTQSREEQAAIRKNISLNKVSFLYISPEMLCNAALLRPLQIAKPKLLVVDEAHCVSQWGSDFRPAYTQIGRNVDDLEVRLGYKMQRVCFTATATERVQADIINCIGMRQAVVIRGSMRRKNLCYQIKRVRKKGEEIEALLSIIARIAGKPTIIYASTIKKVEEIHEALSAVDIRAEKYHGKMDYPARKRVSNLFAAKDISLIVATDAFGMGVDRSDIRFVINVGMPLSIENYVQQAGRAGRDGETAYCILISTGSDSFIHELFLSRLIVPFGDALELFHTLRSSGHDVIPSSPSRMVKVLPEWNLQVEPWDIPKLINHLVWQGSLYRKKHGRVNGVALTKPFHCPIVSETKLYNNFITLRSEQALHYASGEEKLCLAIQIEKYLGGDDYVAKPCGTCSVCTSELEFGHEHAVVIRCIQESGRVYGSTALKHMLTGSRGYFSVRKQKLEKISTFGALAEWSFGDIGRLLNTMKEARLIDRPNNIRVGWYETAKGGRAYSRYLQGSDGLHIISGRNKKVLIREALDALRVQLAEQYGAIPDEIWDSKLTSMLVVSNATTVESLRSTSILPPAKVALYGEMIACCISRFDTYNK